jgi:hypothetical protein
VTARASSSGIMARGRDVVGDIIDDVVEEVFKNVGT